MLLTANLTVKGCKNFVFIRKSNNTVSTFFKDNFFCRKVLLHLSTVKNIAVRLAAFFHGQRIYTLFCRRNNFKVFEQICTFLPADFSKGFSFDSGRKFNCLYKIFAFCIFDDIAKGKVFFCKLSVFGKRSIVIVRSCVRGKFSIIV